MKKEKVFVTMLATFFIAALIGLMFIPAQSSEVVDSPEMIKFENKRKYINFEHEKHNKKYEIGCDECHCQPNADVKSYAKCMSCHDEMDLFSDKKNKKKEVFHVNCITCHQKNNDGKKVKCKECHKKKKKRIVIEGC